MRLKKWLVWTIVFSIILNPFIIDVAYADIHAIDYEKYPDAFHDFSEEEYRSTDSTGAALDSGISSSDSDIISHPDDEDSEYIRMPDRDLPEDGQSFQLSLCKIYLFCFHGEPFDEGCIKALVQSKSYDPHWFYYADRLSKFRSTAVKKF